MIELGMTREQLATWKLTLAKTRHLLAVMPTVTDEVLDTVEELHTLLCQSEADVRTVERQGS